MTRPIGTIPPEFTLPENPRDAGEVVNVCVRACVERGTDIERFLPPGKPVYTAREVVNACGDALTAVGVPNNLKRDEPW